MGIPFDPSSPFERRRLIAHVLLESASSDFEWDLVSHVLSGGSLAYFSAACGISSTNLSRTLCAVAWRASFVLHPALSPFKPLRVVSTPLLLHLLMVFDPIGKFHHRATPSDAYRAINDQVAQVFRPGMWAEQLQRALFDASSRCLPEDCRVGLYVWEIPALWSHRVLHGTYLSTRGQAPRWVRRALNDRPPWRPKRKG